MNFQVVKRIAILAVAGAVLAHSGKAAHATDPRPEARLRVAAIGEAITSQRPAQRDAAGTRELWQLVQETTTDQGGPIQVAADAAIILTAFHASAPENTEEELAREHGLEIVRRVTLSSLDLRVVTYKLRDSSISAEILERLRADPRVSSVAYRAIEPDEAKVSGSELAPNTIKQRTAGKRMPTRAASADIAGKPARPKAASERLSMRNSGPVTATAADVLAGGL
jgi:hypothetical protein